MNCSHWRGGQEPRRGSIPTLPRLALAACCVALAGCGEAPELPTTYGQRSTTAGRASVNGTSVLADMFQQRGWRVGGWRRFSPKLGHSRVIVWAPDDASPPTPEQRQWVHEWLSSGGGRTLVYIGRGYDAEEDYWRACQAIATPEQAIEIQRRLARLDSQGQNRPVFTPLAPGPAAAAAAAPDDPLEIDPPPEWFEFKSIDRRRVESLDGPWSAGVDDNAARVYLTEELSPPSDAIDAASNDNERPYHRWDALRYSTLLTGDGQPLVLKLESDQWWNGQILVVANGSFLLNWPLVNHQHRKLAGRLIDEVGSPDRVTFLESEAGGPPVLDTDHQGQETGLALFFKPPFSTILPQLLLLGLVSILVLFPIFGRPRELPEANLSDFAEHAKALGDQLARTREAGYAMRIVKQYHEMAHRDSAASPPAAEAPVRRRSIRVRIATPIAPGAHDLRMLEEARREIVERGLGEVLSSGATDEGLEMLVALNDTLGAARQLQGLLQSRGLGDNCQLTEVFS